VLNGVTHQPVARALVKTPEGNGVLTDNDGNFEINGLSAGTQQFLLQRPGYEGFEHGQNAHTVMVGANIPSLTFYLTPNAVITGQITLSTSDSADNIDVSAWRKQIQNGHSVWSMAGQAMTNSEGAFHIGNLPAGSYLLYTQPSEELNRAAAGTISSGYPAIYYPGVTDVSAAGMLTLTAGQQARADFTLTQQRFYSVTATVTNATPGPGMGFQIHDRSGRALGFPVRYDQQTQMVHASIPSGNYVLQAGGYGRNRTYGRTEFIVANAPVSGLSITILPLHSIPVNIRKDFTETNSGANGFAGGSSASMDAGMNLSLFSADETFGQNFGGGNLRPVEGVNNGRSFELENTSPGRYWVNTSAFQGYVSSITSGGVDLAREPLTIGPGNTSAPIEVTLRNDTGSITGTINGMATTNPNATGEQPRIHIYAIPLFATTTNAPEIMSNPTGQFSFYNLPPGSYRVIAFDQLQEIDFHTAEGLAALSGKGQTTTVEANGTAHVQLDVIHTEQSQ